MCLYVSPLREIKYFWAQPILNHIKLHWIDQDPGKSLRAPEFGCQNKIYKIRMTERL